MKNCFLLLLNFTGKPKVQKVKEGSTTVYLLGTLCEQARNSHWSCSPSALFTLCA